MQQQKQPRSGVEVADYLAQLQRLADVCRATAATQAQEPKAEMGNLAARIEQLEVGVAGLRANAADNERRMWMLEKSAPDPQLWRDLIRGISSVREAVSELQLQARA